jgi:hypothetical protein
MSKTQATRPTRAGRGGAGRSPYNERGERLERILTRQGRRLKWLLDHLEQSAHPASRPTLYRARLPEDHPLFINVNDSLWVEIAKILNVHPSEILGTRPSEQIEAKAS